MTRSTHELLAEALAHFNMLMSHAEHDLGDQLVIDAVCMLLSAGLEVLSKLDPAKRTQLFGDDWPLMWGMRNRISHGYLLVSSEIIRRTLADDVPTIVERIATEIRHTGG